MYEYEELRAKAIAADATPEDIENLGNWFERYGDQYWNGEYFDADGYRLYPVYEYDEDDEAILKGYEFR